MALITAAHANSFCDYLGNAYALMLAKLGLSTVTAPANTPTKALTSLQSLVLTFADIQQIQSLISSNSIPLAIGALTSDGLSPKLQGPIADLTRHCQNYGSTVAASIVSLPSFLAYYSGGSGGAKFANLTTYEFGLLYQLVFGAYLPYPTTLFESVHPLWNVTLYPSGLGKKTSAGVFTAGVAIDSTKWCEGLPIVIVSTSFSGGGAAPIITVAGTDDTGATSTTWSVTLTGNNPVQALSGITVTPAITAQGRQTVAFSSGTAIVPGSVLVINSGLSDQETIVVEAVSGANITAAFQLAHLAGATVTGSTSATLAPSVATRRIRSISAITISGGGGWAAGTVTVCSGADRVAV